MRFADSLAATLDFVPEQLDNVTKNLPTAWIEEALADAGVATLRKRRLPMQQVVWLALGIALMRNRDIEDVLHKLDLAGPSRSGKPMAPSSISEARQHLGAQPMEFLFAASASRWGHTENATFEWRGLALYGIDGITMSVADTPENRQYFGGQSNGTTQGQSGYPIVRIVALLGLRGRLLAAARIGPYATASELSLSDDLLRDVPDDSLFVADRNFLNARTILPLISQGVNRHFLMRAKNNTVMEPIEMLGKGDCIVELPTSAAARKADPKLPKTLKARAIHYQIAGHDPQYLLTSLLDPKKYPAAELIGIYHERWDLEIAFDEIKTTQLERKSSLHPTVQA